MSKYNVIITSATDSKVVSFKVTRRVNDWYKGRKVGTRLVVAGEGTVIGNRASYGHGNSAGWSFEVKGEVNAENILAGLTDQTNSLYLR